MMINVGREYDSRRIGKRVIPSERLNALRYSWDDSLNLAAQSHYDVAPDLPVLPLQPPVDGSLFYYREDGMPDPRVKPEPIKISGLERILRVIKFWKKR